MGYILDVAVILLFVLSIFFGYRRGFVKSILGLLGCVLAFVIASSLSASIAGGIYDGFVAPAVEKQILEFVPSTDTTSVKQGLQAALDQLPVGVAGALEKYGFSSADDLLRDLDGTLGNTTAEIAAGISQKVVRPVVVLLIKALTFFIIFIVVLVLASVASYFINKFFKLPVLKQMNGTLGAILGAIQGVLWVLVAVTIIQLAALSGGETGMITTKHIDQSILVGRLASVNPIGQAMDDLLKK